MEFLKRVPIMKKHPIGIFDELYQRNKKVSTLKQSGAICISTIDSDGYPDGRFVDLKEVRDEGLIFCTDSVSGKGLSLANNAKVSLTAWWEHIDVQIRVKGISEKLSEEQSVVYWKTRSRSAQLTTWASQQSQPIDDPASLSQRLDHFAQEFEGCDVPKYPTWSGYLIRPKYFEFLTFKESRMHIRRVFKSTDDGWMEYYIQP
jgi:pyridoxamine 5'-phosphate oxidase